jgi:hypothetical protein
MWTWQTEHSSLASKQHAASIHGFLLDYLLVALYLGHELNQLINNPARMKIELEWMAMSVDLGIYITLGVRMYQR